ncbi:MAG TPA: TetR/AcrR family transcriptional regulator [Acidobacteriaceae bacterium]|nr:TetR/AcrR family transcriptional regulator [Acidobacteriaceae bacterium]
MADEKGLRERKKLATKQAISDMATRLFIDRGFDNVTVAEIAEAANVAKMTVFNYFPRKEDLFFDREDEGREMLRDALAQRSSHESLTAAVQHLVHRLVKQKHPFAKFTTGTARFWHTVMQSPALSARLREMRDEFIRDCAKMLADSAGRTHPDPEAHLFASLLTATFSTAYMEALGRQRKGKTSEEVQVTFLSLIDRGFEGIAAAMKATPYSTSKVSV